MFSQLPKLFNRDFVIGYFLPITLFVSVLIGYLSFIYKDVSIISFIKEDLLVGTTVLGLFLWFGSLILLATNRFLIRVLEGYHYLPFKNTLINSHKREFEKLNKFLSEWKEKDQSDDENKKKEAEQQLSKYIRSAQILSEHFPNSDGWILATKFGNTIRGFEVYSNVMYGLDSIFGWSRIVAIMPADFRAIIDSAKAQVDLWVNLLVLNLIFGVIVVIVSGLKFFDLFQSGIELSSLLVSSRIPALIILFVILFYFFFYNRAIEASVGWGNWVKSAFDIYIPKLASSLGLKLPKSRVAEREFWNKFTRAIGYRNPEILPDR